MDNLDTGNIRHTRQQDEDKNKHNTTQRMDNLDTGNIRHTRHMTKTRINITQHNTENGQSRHWQH